eukprot:COSAG01_NODE_14146_length_1491_cov_1.487069_1_plen_107_part_00
MRGCLPQSPELRSKGVAAAARLTAEGNSLLLWIHRALAADRRDPKTHAPCSWWVLRAGLCDSCQGPCRRLRAEGGPLSPVADGVWRVHAAIPSDAVYLLPALHAVG